MLKKNLWRFLTISLIVSCGPAPGSIELTEAQSLSPSPAPTPFPTPTLPPTRTFIETATPTIPTEPAFVSVPMSAADEDVYNRALEDIERYRKGDLVIHLEDDSGNPLGGYEIEFRQVDHDFWFGSGTAMGYIQLLEAAGMNGVTVMPEWWLVEPNDGEFELEYVTFGTAVDELASLGLRVKTNAMFNPADTYELEYMRYLPFELYLERLDRHVSTLVARFAGSIEQWEAILEPNYGNHNPYGWTHEQYLEVISTSIHAIRANDPDARVEISLSYPCGGIDWLDNFMIVEEMLREGIDFDVLGLQLYYNTYAGQPSPTPFARMTLAEMSSCFDRYQEMLAPYGKEVYGSEFGVPGNTPAGVPGYWSNPWSEDLQAQYLATAYTIFFSKQMNHGLIWWDLVSQPGTFVHDGGLINRDGTPRKAYHALQALIENWTSSGSGMTDQDGTFEFRGFGGNYELLITDPSTGYRMRTQVHLTEQETQEVEIKFVATQELEPLEETLTRLIEYWQVQQDDERVQLGMDALALADYHRLRGEVDQGVRTLRDAIDQLAVTYRLTIYPSDFHCAAWQWQYRTIIDNDRAVMWMYQILYYPEAFPAGHATVHVRAAGTPVDGAYPMMVIGIGGHQSPVMTVNQEGIYTAEFDLTGSEQVLTIRFEYNAGGRPWEVDPGGFKIFIQSASVLIEVPYIPE